MQCLDDTFLEHSAELVAGIRAGKIFIYPTDTIYGIGCDATNSAAVEKVRLLKERESKPFLIIAPSLQWVWDNCEVSDEARREIESKLPGRYSFFVKIKNTSALAYDRVVLPGSGVEGTIGVRYLDHPFQQIVSEAGVPFITTSVNLTGQPFAKSVADMPESIKAGVDYIIDVGEIDSTPSTRIDLTH